jgi:hypothetical protein
MSDSPPDLAGRLALRPKEAAALRGAPLTMRNAVLDARAVFPGCPFDVPESRQPDVSARGSAMGKRNDHNRIVVLADDLALTPQPSPFPTRLTG